MQYIWYTEGRFYIVQIGIDLNPHKEGKYDKEALEDKEAKSG